METSLFGFSQGCMVHTLGDIERTYEQSWGPLEGSGMICGALEVTLILLDFHRGKVVSVGFLQP